MPLRSPHRPIRRAGAALLFVGAGALATVPLASRAQSDSPGGASGGGGVIVHIGDSFVDAGLAQTLRPKFAAKKARYLTFGRFNTHLGTWAYGKQLPDLYYNYRPSLFVVTLGASEVAARPPEARAKLVHAIVRQMQGTPCVWISVPLWKGAPTGLVDMIRRECAPCRHFDSSTVAATMSRQADGVHPDEAGGAAWAEAFWKWLEAERDPAAGAWALKPAPADEHAPRP